jgi:hypothetical protein
MRREMGFEMVSMTRIEMEVFPPAREDFIFSHVSIREIISNAVIKWIRSRTLASSVYRGRRDCNRDGL